MCVTMPKGRSPSVTLCCAADDPGLVWLFRVLNKQLQEGWFEIDVVDGIEHGIAEVVDVAGNKCG